MEIKSRSGNIITNSMELDMVILLAWRPKENVVHGKETNKKIAIHIAIIVESLNIRKRTAIKSRMISIM